MRKPKKGHHLVPCTGQAHDPEIGGMIDHCGMCAPRWGWVEVPIEYKSVAEYQEAQENALLSVQKP